MHTLAKTVLATIAITSVSSACGGEFLEAALPRHYVRLRDLEATQDGRWVVGLYFPGFACVWDKKSDAVRDVSQNRFTTAISISRGPSPKVGIALFGRDAQRKEERSSSWVEVWPLNAGKQVKRLAYQDIISAMAISSNGTLIATVEASSGLVVREIDTGHSLGQREFPGGEAVEFSSKDGYVSVGGANYDSQQFPLRWSIKPWKETARGLGPPKSRVLTHKHAQLWDRYFIDDDAGISAWKWNGERELHWPSDIELIGVSPSGARYAQRTLDEVHVRDAASHRLLASRKVASDTDLVEGAMFESEHCLIMGVAPKRPSAPRRLASWTFETAVKQDQHRDKHALELQPK
ncbi:MAG: hypothetical protein KDB14_09190 [Planctomycetales bacterium]|nr:hypothetical protein [Planctomycetales bacterium]